MRRRIPCPVVQGLEDDLTGEAGAGEPYFLYQDVGPIFGDKEFLTTALGE